ncbi:flagellar biosynthesis protein FlhB [Salinarimonas ramus]|uniref:Flagellar biosynthetic protein FlhB n=1 Tax=Salinarimonas ramus TaxID=690164 RepID=A0A917Q6C5_9HYPH|nr:flagellar biosynthesis protein FlhB [Salinarimonas ramus]GGK31139.1 flagellar biosynthesis protein FlhB [Salinarimonas ramus]
MADEEDKDSKTEEPSEKKIRDALDKGNVPVSKEASTFAAVLAALTLAHFVIGNGAGELVQLLGRLMDDPGGFAIHDGTDATKLMHVVALGMGAFLAPIVGILFVYGLAANVLQTPPRFAKDRIQPKLSRLSPMQGFKRLFGAQGWMELAKAVFKFLVVAAVLALLARADAWRVVSAMYADPTLIPEIILSLTIRLLAAICVAIIVLVIADIAFVRFKWRRDLRMSRREMKDEHKQAEGDPLVKARMRSLARDRARRRMIADVPRATIVIANPTHFAIALRYVREEGGAPVVVAKGQDLVALKIREIAESHGIPVIEDKPLARSMYDAVEVDRPIPQEFYRVVAELLYFFYYRQTERAS